MTLLRIKCPSKSVAGDSHSWSDDANRRRGRAQPGVEVADTKQTRSTFYTKLQSSHCHPHCMLQDTRLAGLDHSEAPDGTPTRRWQRGRDLGVLGRTAIFNQTTGMVLEGGPEGGTQRGPGFIPANTPLSRYCCPALLCFQQSNIQLQHSTFNLLATFQLVKELIDTNTRVGSPGHND